MAGKGFGANKWAQRLEPEGKVRQSQIVTTYGPGSMVDLVDDAVLVGGLDFWRFDAQSLRYATEPRLRDAIALRFERQERKLRRENAFVLPPAGNDQDPTRSSGIEVLEFPQWFVCQNPQCRTLIRSEALELKSGRYVHACGRTTDTCVPVRFVMACRRGHLEDFPWMRFVHDMRGIPRCSSPSLTFREGATGDFSEVMVECACSLPRRMADAMVDAINPTCGGQRPWLGREGEEECGEHLRLMVRTASNSYFAQVVSSLWIPDGSGTVRAQVERVWSILKVADSATLGVFRKIPDVQHAIGSLSDHDVLEAIRELKGESSKEQEPLRTAEFKQLDAAKAGLPGEVPDPAVDFFARSATPQGGLPKGIEKLVLAHKLREVRVQIGFTRIESATPDLQGEFDLGVESAPLGLQTDWLPAAEIRGEGIFLKLDEAAVAAWEKGPAVRMRAEQLLDAYCAAMDTTREKLAAKKTDRPVPPFPGARFYMLHSLAHLLTSAVSLECGYPASSIRERIYCAPASDAYPMAGILLSTGTPGTEGTLGGLIEQGRWIRRHFRRAYELGILCSNDPVCAAHDPASDPTERRLEGAACHGCLFIAECSCERFNNYLDRALVVPTLGHEDVAFFKELP